jgi:hypothetical protein
MFNIYIYIYIYIYNYIYPNNMTTGTVKAALSRKKAPGSVSYVSVYNWLYKGYIIIGASVSSIPRTELSCAKKINIKQLYVVLI